MRGEDDGRARAEEPAVGLRGAEPLHMHDVRLQRGEPSHPERMLERLHREPQRETSPCATRAGRTTPAPRIPSGGATGAEPEARCHELDIRARPCERSGQRAVVGRRVRGRIGEDDAHWSGTLDGVSSESRP